MKIFISWSGDRGQHVATTLRDWLPLILPDAKPWTSTELRRGSNWTVELLETLRDARACLFCVTADGLDSTWEYFEAGMLHGSDADPVLTRCVCLDVPPNALAGGPLASIPAIALQRADILALLAEINALLPAPIATAEIEARYERAREFFNARMTALPEARPRHIHVVVPTPQGICPIDVAFTGDTNWATFVAAVKDGVAELVSLPADALILDRCLDLDADAWIAPPAVLAQLKANRIALGPPGSATDSPAESAKLAALQLRQVLDVTPTQQRALAAMRRDLRDLVDVQRAFYDQNARYASTGELDFFASPGTSIEAEHTASGFHAIATRTDVPAGLAIRLGDGAGRFAEEAEGTEFMYEFQPSRFYVLQADGAAGTNNADVPAQEGEPPP